MQVVDWLGGDNKGDIAGMVIMVMVVVVVSACFKPQAKLLDGETAIKASSRVCPSLRFLFRLDWNWATPSLPSQSFSRLEFNSVLALPLSQVWRPLYPI